MKIAVACDHGGLLRVDLVKAVLGTGHEVVDLGTDADVSVDYPDYAAKAIKLLKDGGCDRIVLLCGTGIGMSIAANRVKGIRGTLCHDAYTARMCREHNNSNCLIMGARTTGPAVIEEIVTIWLETEFSGGRHQGRLDKIEQMNDSLG